MVRALSAGDRAKQLGATIQTGINWNWATGFSKENADIFLAWLDSVGYEHRGIYKGYDERLGQFDIRYRY